MICGVQAFIVYFSFAETRGSEILSRRAQMLTERTGVLHLADVDGGNDIPNQSLYKGIRDSVIRPVYYFATEPIVFAMSMWTGLLWVCYSTHVLSVAQYYGRYGLIYLLFHSLSLIYDQYDFSTGQTGTVFCASIVGTSISMVMAKWQDHMYIRDKKRAPSGRAPPESRLYGACVSFVFFGVIAISWLYAPW